MKKGFLFVITLCCAHFYTQEKDSLQLDELIVSAVAPTTQTTLSKKELTSQNLGKDIPFLLSNTPSAIATSDAGNGVGYSGIRIRGTDASRILVSIDGVPINDSESQSVFWVNMPDVASSAKKIIVQRGVGTSANGTSNFGGSIQISSEDFTEKPTASLQSSGGAFTTYKNTIIAESGDLFKQKLHLRLRLSQVSSEGYVDRASSNLWAFQLEANYAFSPTSTLKFNHLGGKEKTYQAWYGIDKYTLTHNRTFNYAGAIYNEDYSEIIGFYPNQTDNYQQNHNILTWNWKWNPFFSLKTTTFFTHGEGYYQELAQFQNPEDYALDDNTTSDLVRRKWLNNQFYGINTVLNYSQGKIRLEGSLSASQYVGNHFGQVVSSEYYPLPHTVEYYRNQSQKKEWSSYLKSTYSWNSLEAYLDLQWRHIAYQAKTPNNGYTTIDDNPNFHNHYFFFNPKVGLNHHLPHGKIYALWAIAQREPTRTDLLENPSIQAEKLTDWELGYQGFIGEKWQIETNLYWMNYKDQMVLSGKLDDVGNPIRENSGKSYRLGWEIQLRFQFLENIDFLGNFTYSKNKNLNYTTETEQGLQKLGNTDIAFSPNIMSSFGIKGKLYPWLHFWVNNKLVGKQYLNNTSNPNLQLHSYFSTDVSLSIQPAIPFQNFSVDLSFYNIFNSLYENNGYVYNDMPYYYPQAGFNFLIGMYFSL